VASCAVGVLLLGVNRRAEAQAATWSVERLRSTRLEVEGSQRGTGLHGPPVGVVLTSDGGFVAADAHSGALIAFDSTGRLTRAVGSPGSGPGEYRHIAWLRQCAGDSLVVWDHARRRLVTYDARLVFAAERPLTQQGSADIVATALACGADGSWAWQSVGRPSEASADRKMARFRGPLLVHPRGADAPREIGQFPSRELLLLEGGAVPLPLGTTSFVALAGGAVWVASSDSAVVHRIPVAGDGPRSAIGIPPVTGPIGDAHRGAAEHAVLRDVPAAVHDRVRDALAAVPRSARRRPQVTQLLADREGFLWVGRSAEGDPARDFLILDLAGSPVARLTVPEPVALVAVARDRLVAVRSDEGDGSVTVVHFRLRRDARR
jgi:hypothetical protein